MPWVKFREKFHGRVETFWKKMGAKRARSQVRQWNKFKNPFEQLSVVKVSKKKPKGIRKTKFRGIYK